jgi:hypothetical protein
VNQADHYKQTRIEAIDVILDWSLDFCLGNCLKYLARHKYKGNPIADLEKARWYLDREIHHLKLEANCEKNDTTIGHHS